MGFLIVISRFNIVLDRYEWFQRKIRKKKIRANRKKLSMFYSILYFSTGIPVIITAIIGFIYPDVYEQFSTWLWVVLIIVAIGGITYCNVTKRFFDSIENYSETDG